MINLTYKDFMKLIKQKRLFLMQFHIKGYNHYNSCVIRTSYDKVNYNLKNYQPLAVYIDANCEHKIQNEKGEKTQ